MYMKKKDENTIELFCHSKHKIKLRYHSILDRIYLSVKNKYNVKESNVILDRDSVDALFKYLLWETIK